VREAYACWSEEVGQGSARSHVVFAVEGMRCASCSQAVERAVLGVRGTEQATVNVATGRAAVDFDPRETTLKAILAAVAASGFRPVPLAGEASARAQRAERHSLLKRLGLAGLGMMQTMMVIDGLYAAGHHGIDAHIAQYLRLAAMLIATPVFLYSGAPFLTGAWADLRRRTLGMDVPVAIAIVLAYAASVVNTLRGAGEVYFDSVTMFIFFLLTGRYIEMSVRHRSLSAAEALARSLPATVSRLLANGSRERVSVQVIGRGDRLSIPRGAVVPVDAVLDSASATLDESLVTGESAAISRARGARLLGGSVNVGDAIEVTAQAPITDSALAALVGLLERTQAQRPALARAADRIASHFVLVTLLLAAVVALSWLFIDPRSAFGATLAVLVVTCPCALSLAAPAAAAAATTRLARCGLLVTRADALERLAHIDTLVIDKTGTLTTRHPEARVLEVREGLTAPEALALAAALERASDHPLAAAFNAFDDPAIPVTALREFPGQGVEGSIRGSTWRLGRFEFAAAFAGGLPARADAYAPTRNSSQAGALYLGNAEGIASCFAVTDSLRAGARRAVEELQRLGIETIVASGDREEAVRTAALRLGIGTSVARLEPVQKLALVHDLQSRGRQVLMVGDGINDGPVLAAAHVSCAMGQGSAIAQAASDLLLLNESLAALAAGVRTARHAARIARQNLTWAFVYNVTAVPLAALGWVQPWVAALGMSASSLVVVLNAARLARTARRRPRTAAATGPERPADALGAAG
jgi:Cu2+-exporting ATPase